MADNPLNQQQEKSNENPLPGTNPPVNNQDETVTLIPDTPPAEAQVPAPPPSFVNTADVNPPQAQPVADNSTPTPPPPVFTQSSEATVNNGPLIANLKPKKNPFTGIVGIVLLVIILVAVGGFIFLRNRNSSPSLISNKDTADSVIPKQSVQLTYWGLWEPSAVLQNIIAEYQNQNPQVTINYVEESKTDYRTRLQSALENGSGPDIFRYHNTWLPMLSRQMQPDSKKRVALDDFYPIIKENASIGGETFGVPLGFDTLMLYYNTSKFQSAGISQAPTSWEELIDDAQKLAVVDKKSGIQVGGIAMGTTNNVDHWSDIVGLLLMQNGSDPSGEVPVEVLEFYTQFANSKKVWDATLPNSTYAFATEKVAMMFAPSWRAHEIRAINPNLEFKTAPVPQLTATSPVTWASYWLEGVSRQSKNADEAWKFLAYMSSNETLTKLYTTAAQSSPERRFGEPYPKISLASSLQSDPVVGSVVQQGPYAKSWYLCARTYDDGLNDGIIKYYEDAINGINRGSDPSQVLPALTSGVQQKLSLFGLVSASKQQ